MCHAQKIKKKFWYIIKILFINAFVIVKTKFNLCCYFYIGASLGALSAGRVAITSICAINTSLAVTIAIRYCATRKQFGPNSHEEWPVLEYQVQVNLNCFLKSDSNLKKEFRGEHLRLKSILILFQLKTF